MYLIVGLGNPGPKYAETRHNAGFWFLDALLHEAGATLRQQSRLQAETARAEVAGAECLLARPTTFMNHSGQAVQAVAAYYKVPAERVLVAYDELDLPPGVARLKAGGGHGGHNGLRDVCRHLGTHDFLRLRLGIGHPGHKDAVTGYVLGRASADCRAAVDRAIECSLEVIPLVLAGQLQNAMTRLHTATSPAANDS
jgi:PTH1 family peptidyl-tRNA hydrolase